MGQENKQSYTIGKELLENQEIASAADSVKKKQKKQIHLSKEEKCFCLKLFSNHASHAFTSKL